MGALKPLGAMTLALVCLAAIYWPGLSGPFMFDDHWNLAKLGESGGIESSRDWIRFVMGGEAGPLGRPVRLASFTINATNWPADAWPFKFTNLIIHIANTALLFFLARSLFVLGGLPHASVLACTCATLWALHPLHVSTVLYVVQRMAQLATFFTFVGILTFVHGRVLAATKPTRGYFWMVSGIGIGTILAVFSKENGVLLVLSALTIEITVLSTAKLRPPPAWNLGRAALLHSPILIIIAYIAYSTPDWIIGYLHRDFTLINRIAVQGPILWDYIQQFFMPRLAGTGLFRSVTATDYSIIAAALGWIGVILLISIALILRKAHPLISAGVLWFFAGHALESTILPLELYFEHRNYLPFAGLSIATVAIISKLPNRPAIIISIGLLIMWGLGTNLQARVWGNGITAATIWTHEHPDSLRAVQFAAGTLQQAGRLEESRKLLEKFSKQHPENPSITLQLMELNCIVGNDVRQLADDIKATLRTEQFSYAIPTTFNRLLQLTKAKQCAGLDLYKLINLMDAALSNHRIAFQGRAMGQILLTKAATLAAQGKTAAALQVADEASRVSTQVNAPYWKSIWTLEQARCDASLRYAAEARAVALINNFSPNPPIDFLDSLDKAIQNSVADGLCI